MTAPHPQTDPVTTAVIRHGLVAAGDEMMTNVKRAAYSPSIHQIQDVCVGLVDATGRILTCAPGLPMFLADMGEVVRDGLELVGLDAFEPGDVYISNDPFSIGTHINNVATYSPVFIDGRLVAFAVVRGHMVDMGGAVPGSRSTRLTEIYQEGLRVRQLRFYAAGQPVTPIHRLIADNTRMPDAVLGDLRAQVAACRTGERRLTAMIQRYGLPAFEAAVSDIFEQGERLARAAVSAIPDGTYRAEAFLDDDGIVIGERVPIRVVVEVHGDEMTIDFSNFAAQRKGSINTGVNGAISIARNAFKCLTTAHEPVNEGHFRPLTVVAPVGTVVSAVPPAACGWWARTTSTTLDAILRALSPALPKDIPAGHFGDIPMCLINGIDNAGRRFVFFEPVPGGHGGRPHEDGVSATVCFHEGDTPDVPVEVQEATMPILIEESALDVDSAGAGRFRGGLGYRRIFRLLSAEAAMQINIDRHYCLPWGLNGGLPGMPNRAFIQRDAGAEWELVLKQDGIQLEPGARVMLVGGGGGGWGDPLERDLDAIAEDLVDGYVTSAAAGRDYNVEIDPDTGVPKRQATASDSNGSQPAHQEAIPLV
jgi:N-methylhydantoinase B